MRNPIKYVGLIAFVALGTGGFAALLAGPKEGVYSLQQSSGSNNEDKVFMEIVLAAKQPNGFVVSGWIQLRDSRGITDLNISGVMNSRGKLLAKYYKGTNQNNAANIDGYWSDKDNTLVISKTSSTEIFSANTVLKPTKSRSGVYSGQDWGKVVITCSPTSLSGTYHVSEKDRGTFSLTLKDGKYEGTWTNPFGHNGTVTASRSGNGFSVSWKCTGACKGKSGTSQWDPK